MLEKETTMELLLFENCMATLHSAGRNGTVVMILHVLED